MPFFENHQVKVYYQEAGSGTAFVFQHGLGADLNQPFELLKAMDGVRLIAFDARGHGLSESGPVHQISLSTFADDLLALLDHLQLANAVIGGISMGAAIALKFALRHPEKVAGLVLSRPAWQDGPNPFNARIFPMIAELIKSRGPERGLEMFRQRPEFAALEEAFPDTANSLSNQFRNPRACDVAASLERIPPEAVFNHPEQLGSISIPTLILANRNDPIHPFQYGRWLAGRISGARLHEIVSKSRDFDLHIAQVQGYIREFFAQNFLCKTTL